MAKSKLRKNRRRLQFLGLSHHGKVSKDDKQSKIDSYHTHLETFRKISVADLAAMRKTGKAKGAYKSALEKIILEKIIVESKEKVDKINKETKDKKDEQI